MTSLKISELVDRMNVPEGVFVPTGTSHLLVECVLQQERKFGRLLDLGCGSGLVGISLLLSSEQDSKHLYASDVSERATLATAANCEECGITHTVKTGTLFSPWEGHSFDTIVNDVSGVSETVADISPWFSGVPCESGADGTKFVNEIIKNASDYLSADGVLYFPVLSLSAATKTIELAHEIYEFVERIGRSEWLLPKEMQAHSELLLNLRDDGLIDFNEKFGAMVWWTEIYAARNVR